MLNDKERLAIQKHAETIEKFEAARAEEEKRLRESSEMNALYKRVYGIPDDQGKYPVPVRGKGPREAKKKYETRVSNELQKRQELKAWLLGIENHLKEYDKSNKPSLIPWDTPQRILDTIQKKEFLWDGGLRHIMALVEADHGVVTAPQDEKAWRQQEVTAAETVHEEINERVWAFVDLAPSIRELPAETNVRAGITRLRDWCKDAMRTVGLEVLGTNLDIAPEQKESAQSGVAPPPGDGKSFSTSELCDLVKLKNGAINRYAKQAGVTTPGRGQRNHRYTGQDSKKILLKIAESPERTTRELACRALKDLW